MKLDIKTGYKENNIWIKIFFCMLAFVPMGIALLNAITYWNGRNDDSKTIIILMSILIGIGILSLCNKVEREYTMSQEIGMVLMYTFIGFTLRYVCAEWLNTYPVSDSGAMYRLAKALEAEKFVAYEEFSYYPHWGLWGVMLGNIMRIFEPTLPVVRSFCIVLSTLNIPVYYLVVKRACKNVNIAKVTMLLIAVSPGMILLSGVLVNSHMTLLFTGLFFLCLSYAQEYREKNMIGKAVIFYLLTGLCLGVYECFKLAGFLLLLSVLAGELATNLWPAFLKLVREKDWKNFLVKIGTTVTILLLLFMCMKLAVSVQKVIIKDQLELEVQELEEADLEYYSIYAGLNIEANGVYTDELANFRWKMIEKYPDDNERIEAYKDLILEQVTSNPSGLWNLMKTKFGIVWGSAENTGEAPFISWALKYNEDADEAKVLRYREGYAFVRILLRDIAAAFWGVLLFGATFGAISGLYKKSSYTYLVCMVYIFGFALLMQLMLTSARYKEIVYIPLIVCAAKGYYELNIIIKSAARRIGNKLKSTIGEKVK